MNIIQVCRHSACSSIRSKKNRKNPFFVVEREKDKIGNSLMSKSVPLCESFPLHRFAKESNFGVALIANVHTIHLHYQLFHSSLCSLDMSGRCKWDIFCPYRP